MIGGSRCLQNVLERNRHTVSFRAHEEAIVRAGFVPHGLLQVTQEDRAWKAEERGATWAGGGGGVEEWTDFVSEDRRVFNLIEDWNTAALDPEVWYNTLCLR